MVRTAPLTDTCASGRVITVSGPAPRSRIVTVPEPVSAMFSSKVATRLAWIDTLVAASSGFLLVMAGSVSGAGTAEMLTMSALEASKASPLITALLLRNSPPASFRSVMANATPWIV